MASDMFYFQTETYEYAMLLFCLVDSILLFGLSVFYIIALTDLEQDYLNVEDCCEKLNWWGTPRFVGHLLMVFGYALAGKWYLFGINIPFSIWLGYQQYWVPSGNLGLYDSTLIYSRGQVKREIQNCMYIVFWFLASFFLNMYLSCHAFLSSENH